MITIKRFSLTLNIILIALLGAGAYQFIVRGSVAPAPDGRTAVLMTSAERAHVLTEMRGLVEALQTITQAVAANDMQTIEKTARAGGMKKTKSESPAFMGKLPLEFKKLGFGLHKKFDLLADTAASTAQKDAVLEHISDLMLNCVACHASYSIKATD